MGSSDTTYQSVNTAGMAGWRTNFWIYRWVGFAVLALAYLLAQFHRNSIAIVANNMITDLAMTGVGLGLLASGYFYAYGVMQVPGGVITDRFGPRKTATVCFALGAIGSILLGLAPNAFVALIARIMVGLGVAMVFVPAMKYFSYWFRQSEFAMLAGFFMAAGGAGALLASSPMAIMSSLVGWRGSYIIIGIFSLLTAVALWVIIRDKPDQKGFNGRVLLGLTKPGEEHLVQSVVLPLKQSFKIIAANGSFWLLCIANFINFGISYAFISLWCGPYLQQIYGFKSGRIGVLLTLFAVFMILGSFVISKVSNRLQSRKIVLLFSFGVSFVMMLMITLKPAGLPEILFYIMFILLGLVSHPITAIFATCANEMFHRSVNGTATGIINTFSFIGGGVAQVLMGRFLDWYSGGGAGVYDVKTYAASFVLLTVGMAIAFILTLFVKEPYKPC